MEPYHHPSNDESPPAQAGPLPVTTADGSVGWSAMNLHPSLAALGSSDSANLPTSVNSLLTPPPTAPTTSPSMTPSLIGDQLTMYVDGEIEGVALRLFTLDLGRLDGSILSYVQALRLGDPNVSGADDQDDMSLDDTVTGDWAAGQHSGLDVDEGDGDWNMVDMAELDGRSIGIESTGI